MEIRPMEQKDIAQVAAIESDTFSKPWSCESFEKSLKLSNTIYLVVDNHHEIVGYCGIYCMFDEGNITNVAVKKDVRNKGIGYGMLLELLKEAKKYAVESVFLEVRKSNEAAIHLYEQLGFKSEGIRKDFYEMPREDAIIMWKHKL